LRERAGRERPREGGIDGGADLIRGERRRECPLGGGVRISAVECDRRCGAVGHGIRHAEMQRRGRGLRAGGGVFGVAPATEREPAAGQQLKRLGSPHARNQGELVASRGRDEDVDGPLRFAVFEERGGERYPCCADEARVQPASQVGVLFRCGQRHLQVAGGERCERAVDKVPRQCLDVARQARRLDRIV
jgi:hypothetical protein